MNTPDTRLAHRWNVPVRLGSAIAFAAIGFLVSPAQAQNESDGRLTTTEPTSTKTTIGGGVRATSRGVRATSRGVRATSRGVRAPNGGSRAPGSPRSGGSIVFTSSGGSGGTSYGTNYVSFGSGPTYYYGSSSYGCGHAHCYGLCGHGWGYGFGVGSFWPSYHRYPGFYGYNVIPERYRGPVDGPPGALLTSPNGEPPAEPEPLTSIEVARILMEYDEVEDAIGFYREHLSENPDDTLAVREYAVALFEDGQIRNGIALLQMTYSEYPGLANIPVEAWVWGDSSLRLREQVVDAVRHAHREPSGGAWLMVGVLMQAEGRDAVALRMIDRAREQGLDEAIASPMATQLAQR